MGGASELAAPSGRVEVSSLFGTEEVLGVGSPATLAEGDGGVEAS